MYVAFTFRSYRRASEAACGDQMNPTGLFLAKVARNFPSHFAPEKAGHQTQTAGLRHSLGYLNRANRLALVLEQPP
jgi:hypothetical protein